jgi:F420-0:gamma-glutamyl ligase-like protein
VKLRCAGVGVLMVGIIIGTSAMGILQGFLRQKYNSKWPTAVAKDVREKVGKGLTLIRKRF